MNPVRAIIYVLTMIYKKYHWHTSSTNNYVSYEWLNWYNRNWRNND